MKNFDDEITATPKKLLADMLVRDSSARHETCATHGAYESHNIIGKIWSICPVCNEEIKAATERERIEAEDKERNRVWKNRLGEAGIPERFRNRTLASYVASNAGQRRALAFATEYAEQFMRVCETGRGAIFCGLPGTGKTHLAIGICLHIIGLRKTAAFTSVQRMILRVKDSWRKDSTESETDVLDMLVYPDLLVIDEIGVQFGSEFEKNFMFLLLNERYEKSRPTLLLSNLTAVEVKTFLGERIYDRLREDGGQAVSFDWKSHRGAA